MQAFHELPTRDEWSAAIQAGNAGKLWYERSSAAFDALLDSQPKLFQPGDRDKFLNFVAALSPQQPVSENLRMAVDLWGKWNKKGRPVDVKWGEDGKTPDSRAALYKLLKRGVDLPARLNNAIRELSDKN